MNRAPFLLVGLLVLAACQKAPEKKTIPPVPVELATVKRATVPVELRAIGTVEPLSSVQLKSKVSGEILEVLFADGASVKAGDPLFRIDPRTFEAALKRAEANVAISQSDATNASEQAGRYTALTKSGVASKEQFSQYLSTAESRKAELAARQADLDEARLSLEWTQVRSPITGRAGAALLKAGNIAQANTETLAIINQTRPIYVSFSLPESALADVRNRMAAGNPQVTVYSPADGRELGRGELTFIDNAVDRNSGMLSFKATFANDDETLWPGQFVDVTLRLAEEKDVLTVPATAVVEVQQGTRVFVVENGTAEMKNVEPGRTTGGITIIQSGLEEGQQVISTGQLRVAPGAKVRAVNAEKP